MLHNSQFSSWNSASPRVQSFIARHASQRPNLSLTKKKLFSARLESFWPKKCCVCARKYGPPDAPRSLTGFSATFHHYYRFSTLPPPSPPIRSVLMTPNGLIIFRGNQFMTRAMLENQVIGPAVDHLLKPFSHLQTHTRTRPLTTIESCEFIGCAEWLAATASSENYPF